MLKTAIRSFHAVARHGGFTAAAQHLHISQPTLSSQVKALEERYEVELFDRVGREVRLTMAGNELFQVTSRLHQIEEEIEDLLNSFRGLQSGTLRIAAVGPFHAIDMIATFKRDYPKIDITVGVGNSQHCFDQVIAIDADVALIADVSPDPRVEVIPYSSHDVVVIVDAAHPFFKRSSISIQDLQGQKAVQREQGSTTRMALELSLLEHDVSIEPVLDIHSREGVWKAVERGLGIGFVADFEFVPHPNLKAIKISDATIRTQYHLAYLRERKQSRLIRAFADIAKRPKRSWRKKKTKKTKATGLT